MAAVCLPILFHPDCYRRLWRLTRSADRNRDPLAGFPMQIGLPPVGIFTPP